MIPRSIFVRLKDERSAQSRLEDILGSETRNAIAKHDLIEIVRTDKNRKPMTDESLKAGPGGHRHDRRVAADRVWTIEDRS